MNMSFDSTRPADIDLVKKSAELIRENFEGLRKDGIVLAKPPLYGKGVPTASVGENGDRYIDTATGNHYYKNTYGTWNINLSLDDKYKTINDVAILEENLQQLATALDNYSHYIVGEYRIMSRKKLPDGWVKCDGSLYSPQKYPKAFAIYGTTFGGDGVNSFAVPDFYNHDDEQEGDAIFNILTYVYIGRPGIDA